MERSAGSEQHGLLLAAAGILLATAVAMTEVRFDDKWGSGVHLAIAAATFGLLFFLGARERFADGPRGWQSALLISAIVVLVVAVLRLGDSVTDDPFDNSLTIAWMATIFAAIAAVAAFYYGSAVCTLFSAIGVTIAIIALLDKANSNDLKPSDFKLYLSLLAAAFGAGAIALPRVGRPRHAVQLVNAAGLALLAVTSVYLVESFAGIFDEGFGDGDGPGFATDSGWELVLIAGSLWILAYAALKREAGPGYIGAIVLFLSSGIAAVPEDPGEATIVGWPLVMLLLAVAAFALAFRSFFPDGSGGGGAPAGPPPPGGLAPTAPGAPVPPPVPGAGPEPPTAPGYVPPPTAPGNLPPPSGPPPAPPPPPQGPPPGGPPA